MVLKLSPSPAYPRGRTAQHWVCGEVGYVLHGREVSDQSTGRETSVPPSENLSTRLPLQANGPETAD